MLQFKGDHFRMRETGGASPPSRTVRSCEHTFGSWMVVKTDGVHAKIVQNVTQCRKSEVLAMTSSAPLQSAEKTTPVQAIKAKHQS